jgi:hypothetical protein
MPDALDGLLDDEVVLYSPVVFTPQRGKPIVATYLSAAKSTFAAIGFDADTGPSFRYIKHVVSGDTAVLEFEARTGDRELQGVDILKFADDSDQIVELTVMVRPMSGLAALGEQMRAKLEAAGAV